MSKNNKYYKEKDLNLDYSNLSKIIDLIITNFEKQILYNLHRLDEHLLQESLIHNRKDLIQLTLISYSLRKLLSKKHITSNIKWKDIKEKIIFKLNKAKDLFKSDIKKYRSTIKNIINLINNTDKLLGYFITNIIPKSKIKLASSAYAHGLSLSKSCDLFNVSKDNVMALIGTTKMPDEQEEIKSIKERVSYLCKKDTLEDNNDL